MARFGFALIVPGKRNPVCGKIEVQDGEDYLAIIGALEEATGITLEGLVIEEYELGFELVHPDTGNLWVSLVDDSKV